jgi:hypothetical protein
MAAAASHIPTVTGIASMTHDGDLRGTRCKAPATQGLDVASRNSQCRPPFQGQRRCVDQAGAKFSGWRANDFTLRRRHAKFKNEHRGAPELTPAVCAARTQCGPYVAPQNRVNRPGWSQHRSAVLKKSSPPFRFSFVVQHPSESGTSRPMVASWPLSLSATRLDRHGRRGFRWCSTGSRN